MEQFRLGLGVELEHGRRDPATNVSDDDEVTTGKIAWAHLTEFPDYYMRLAKMEAPRPRAIGPNAIGPPADRFSRDLVSGFDLTRLDRGWGDQRRREKRGWVSFSLEGPAGR